MDILFVDDKMDVMKLRNVPKIDGEKNVSRIFFLKHFFIVVGKIELKVSQFHELTDCFDCKQNHFKIIQKSSRTNISEKVSFDGKINFF
jgi:hypothetical protein